jgi:hypothetical protein
MAFPLQLEISAVRRLFASPRGRNNLIVAEAMEHMGLLSERLNQIYPTTITRAGGSFSYSSSTSSARFRKIAP